MNRYIILHRITGDDFPRPVVIASSSIIAVEGLEDGNTRIFFHPQAFWNVAEDDQSVLTALGFFDAQEDQSKLAYLSGHPVKG